jgi:iron complex transport system ATP-binding protein
MLIFMSRVLDFNNITVKRDGKSILNNLDWQVESNQRWVIVGPNGAGKTTLLRVAAAQIQPTSGTAKILGETLGAIDVFELKTRIGFASNALSQHIPNSETVLDAVMTASYGVTGRWNEKYEDVDQRRANRVLAEWQLDGYGDRPFGTLSDGEKKRTQIARSVMTDPELLLLDEPVASLDMAAREHTIEVLSSYAKAPTAPAIVMVTHHIEEIPDGFTHALILSRGQAFAAGELASTLTTEKVSEAFGYPLEVTSEAGRFRVRSGNRR